MLVIEDEVLIALDIVQDLESWGLPVAGVASTRDEALRLAESGEPALALVDVTLMRGEDGVALAKELKARFGLSIVFLTAHSDGRTRSRMQAVAPEACLFKPYAPGALRRAMRRVLAE
ncbi:MAG TPA: response regulator [Alphaproteobacteria bacterium]|nr:response regulator [Alphaproteobacteria bacterium]